MGARSLVVVTALFAGCAGFHAPRAETLASLRPMPLATLVPGRFEVEIETPGLTGTFDAVSAVFGRGVRMQWFPDVGGKVLDLRVDADAVVADLPGHHYEAKAPLEAAEPHLGLVFAIVLAELLAPVTPERVRGERSCDGATELCLLPALGAGSVVARLATDGSVASYRLRLGWIDCTLDAEGTLRGRDCVARLRRMPADER
ncbi:MAG: hypothetical protein JNK15_23450 [Planctomycetes bacterium]|nr:hypothetical protein [Planctomycetota bacterium]